MKITQINIKKLFELYNHEIKLNLNEKITIIHGQNGVGKTIILKMLKSIFNDKYDIFYKIPFEEFSIKFDNGDVLFLKKRHNEQYNQEELTLILNDDEQSQIQLAYMSDEQRFKNVLLRNKNLRRIGSDKWVDILDGEVLDTKDLLDRYDPILLDNNATKLWFTDLKEKIIVDFIETQRLVKPQCIQNKYISHQKMPIKETVSDYSSELAEIIQKKLAEYATLSQSLDRSFPIRLAKKTHDVDPSELKANLSKLEKRRINLIQIGVLDADNEFDYLTDIPEVTPENSHVISVYIEDVETKLDVFNDIMQKLNLFAGIINNRFANKCLSVNKDKGFVIKTSNGKEIQPTDLSSGEQQELVVYYELLFKIAPGSLILIDEPELSLHIGWQNEFLKDLLKVIDLVDFDVLIATHSPDIISDRWDLTVQLETNVVN